MLPKVNSYLYLQVASLDEAEAQEEHKARIADIVQGEYIAMEIPINVKTGRLRRLLPGDQISVYFLSDGGVKNFFNSEVMGFKEEVIRLVLIKVPEPEAITRVQRRSYLRVPAELEVAIKLQEKLQIVLVSDDVGGGGLSFTCEGHIPFKAKEIVSGWLLLHFKNGQVDHMPFKAEVVRIKPLETGRQLIMCSFTDIADPERQKVIRYCFERQLDFRKK
jgi:c-di-GMP-binding flagellar brake protein YcgR